ncbi:hypothetical protein CAEBREN_11416 [Caenorhabditis brenneri]|uniref:Uncharacterized protein n=1 Tax=Caenorhabditis brenneri TaxID=135651 RepID=G0MW54_CAEBE|nr:hypothetical protein CAEBREN_11416 [Caenorhabditis brenneri]
MARHILNAFFFFLLYCIRRIFFSPPKNEDLGSTVYTVRQKERFRRLRKCCCRAAALQVIIDSLFLFIFITFVYIMDMSNNLWYTLVITTASKTITIVAKIIIGKKIFDGSSKRVSSAITLAIIFSSIQIIYTIVYHSIMILTYGTIYNNRVVCIYGIISYVIHFIYLTGIVLINWKFYFNFENYIILEENKPKPIPLREDPIFKMRRG